MGLIRYVPGIAESNFLINTQIVAAKRMPDGCV